MANSKEIRRVDLVAELVRRIPDLEEPLAREASAWSEYGVTSLGPDAVFGTVLAPYMIERLKSDESGEDEVLRRIFAFLEELASSDDEGKLSAVDVSFGESFLDDLHAFERSKKYIGPRLKERLRGVQALWKKPR